MKWTRIGVIAVVLAAAAGERAAAQSAQSDDLLARQARLVVANVSLATALEQLRRTSGVALAYSTDLLPPTLRVSCDCADSTVGQALERLLSETDLVFEAGRRQVVIGRRPPPPGLSGQILEAGSGRPLPAIEVSVAGGSAVLTGDDGRFFFEGLDNGPVELHTSGLGYEPEVRRVESSAAPVLLELTRAPIPLAEIVIAPGRLGVLEVSPALSGSRVSREDIEAIPQFGDDVFRTLKRMPGVAAEDISTKLNVRGGTDRDLLVHLDGVELFEPYHLKDLDGALGIVDVQALGGVDLVTGGFPAEYGDKTAGVFNMYTRGANTAGRRTIIGMSLSSLSAISQGGFGEGRGQWLLSLRRGFLEYVLSITGVDDELDPRFWDALGRVQYLVNDNHLLSLNVLAAGDRLDWRDAETGSEIGSDWMNAYAWAGWNATWSDRIRSKMLASVGGLSRDRLGDVDNPRGGAFTPLTADVRDVASFDFFGFKQDWQLDLTDDLMLKTGGEFRTGSGDYDYSAFSSLFDLTATNQVYLRSDTTLVSVDPSGDEAGAYLSLRGRLSESFTWEAGARYDWREHTGDEDVSPRLLLRYDLSPATRLKGSLGRYYQSHGLHELSTGDGEDVFARSEMADQVALGFERDLPDGLSLRVEGYARRVDRPRPIFVNLSRAVNPIMEVESDRARLDPAEARAKGLEFVLAKDGTGAADWSASYALSKAEDLINGEWSPRTLDQLHTLNLRGAYRFGGHWQISGTWSYHTGWPYTEQFLDVEVGLSEDGSEVIDVQRRGFGPYNANRLPSYHRLDVRITRDFDFDRSRLQLFLDVFNAYNRTNLRGYQWWLRGSNGSYSAQRSTGEEQLPILPTIGFRWIF